MKNEQTSARVAKIAGRVLERLTFFQFDDDSEIFACSGEEHFVQVDRKRKLTYPSDALFSVGDLKALAASALTQTKDRKRT